MITRSNKPGSLPGNETRQESEHKESGPFQAYSTATSTCLLLPVTVVGPPGLDGTLPSPLENLSWGLLIKF